MIVTARPLSAFEEVTDVLLLTRSIIHLVQRYYCLLFACIFAGVHVLHAVCV